MPSPGDGVVLSDQYFKNIQALKGIPVDEFMDTMGMFAAATGMNCVDCHVSDAGGDWAHGNPHMWLDVALAKAYTERLRDGFSKADPAHVAATLPFP